jgi:hypothetical protein
MQIFAPNVEQHGNSKGDKMITSKTEKKFIWENSIIFSLNSQYYGLEICIFYQSNGGIEFDNKNKFAGNSCEAMGMD